MDNQSQTSSYFSVGIWSYRLPIPMSTSKADFWSVEGWISASHRETLTYLAPKSFNTNSGVQLSMETKSARSRVACESSLLLHWIDAIVQPEYSSSRCCVIKSPIQSLEFIPLTYILTITFAQKPQSIWTTLATAQTPWPKTTAQFYCAARLRSLVKGDSAFWRACTKLYFENKCRRLHFGFWNFCAFGGKCINIKG